MAFDLLGAGDIELLGDDELLGDADLLGALDELDTVLGSRGRRGISRRRQPGRAGAVAKLAYKRSLGRGAASGAPPAGAKEWPLGLSTVVFTPTSGLLLNATARPQRLFRGRRLVVVVTRTAGAAAVAITVNQIFIGADNQLIAATPLPAEMFGPTAVDTSLVFTPASPGIDVVIQFAANVAPGAGESVTVTSAIAGDSWGS